MLNVEGLTAFVAIAQERSFSRAADRINIVQSVISKRLARLEDQLGAQLVDRTRRNNIQLTRIGGIFLGEAEAALQGLLQAEQIGLNLTRGRAGPFRIGFVFSATLNGTLTQLLSALHANFPNLELRPSLMETPEQLQALGQGQIDLGLLRPRPSYPAGCAAQTAMWEPLRVFMARDHPLAAVPSLTAPQCADQRFIVPQFEESVGLIESIERLAQMGGFAMPEILRTGDFVTAACLAAAGKGVALAPASLSNFAVRKLVAKPLAEYEDAVEMVMVYRSDAPREPLQLCRSMVEKRSNRGSFEK